MNEELNYTKEILSFFPDLRGKRVLDVGCGKADLLINCCLLGAKEAVGIDFVAEVVKDGLKNVKNSGFEKRINVVQADALKIPFSDNSFDVVISFGLLEHFEKPSELIFEKQRVLKENGFLIALVPNSFSILLKSLARPLVRQPDLPRLWFTGGPDRAECISCNACLPTGELPLACRAELNV